MLFKEKFNKYWFLILGLILGLCISPLQVTGFNLQFFPGDFGDARFNNFILEHGYQWLIGDYKGSFWDANFMFPEKKVITYSDNLLGSMPIYAFYRLLSFSRESSFVLWFITLSILNYLCSFILFNKLFKNHYSAVLGAFIFAFSIAMQSQMTHAQVFPRFAIPLVFYFGILFFETKQVKFLFLSIFSCVYQFYCGIYLGFLLFVPVFFYYLLKIYDNRIELFSMLRNKKWLLSVVLSFISNLTFLLILMIPYYQRSKLLPDQNYSYILPSIPTLKSFFYAHPGSFFWDVLEVTGRGYPAPWDHQIFVGGVPFIAIIFLIIFLFKRKIKFKLIEKDRLIFIFCFIITFLLFTRFQGLSLYAFLFKLPGFSAMRSLTRIINVELLFFGFFVALVFHFIFSKIQSKYYLYLSTSMLIVLCLDNYVPSENTYRTDKDLSIKKINKVIRNLKSLPENAVISYEAEKEEPTMIDYQLDAMLASQQMRMKCVNGYTATSPSGYDSFWWKMDEESRNIWVNKMKIKEQIHVIKVDQK